MTISSTWRPTTTSAPQKSVARFLFLWSSFHSSPPSQHFSLHITPRYGLLYAAVCSRRALRARCARCARCPSDAGCAGCSAPGARRCARVLPPLHGRRAARRRAGFHLRAVFRRGRRAVLPLEPACRRARCRRRRWRRHLPHRTAGADERCGAPRCAHICVAETAADSHAPGASRFGHHNCRCLGRSSLRPPRRARAPRAWPAR